MRDRFLGGLHQEIIAKYSTVPNSKGGVIKGGQTIFKQARNVVVPRRWPKSNSELT